MINLPRPPFNNATNLICKERPAESVVCDAPRTQTSLAFFANAGSERASLVGQRQAQALRTVAAVCQKLLSTAQYGLQ